MCGTLLALCAPPPPVSLLLSIRLHPPPMHLQSTFVPRPPPPPSQHVMQCMCGAIIRCPDGSRTSSSVGRRNAHVSGTSPVTCSDCGFVGFWQPREPFPVHLSPHHIYSNQLSDCAVLRERARARHRRDGTRFSPPPPQSAAEFGRLHQPVNEMEQAKPSIGD